VALLEFKMEAFGGDIPRSRAKKYLAGGTPFCLEKSAKAVTAGVTDFRQWHYSYPYRKAVR
jgi:hypothetical protein